MHPADNIIILADRRPATGKRSRNFPLVWRAQLVARLRYELAKAEDRDWIREFEEFRAATLALAETPAVDRAQMRMKQSGIGRLWLRAEGPFYDRLRSGVRADELGFGERSKAA